jgi:hypothetical protein
MKTCLPPALRNVRLGQICGNEKLAKALEATLRVKNEGPIILPFPRKPDGPKRAA